MFILEQSEKICGTSNKKEVITNTQLHSLLEESNNGGLNDELYDDLRRIELEEDLKQNGMDRDDCNQLFATRKMTSERQDKE